MKITIDITNEHVDVSDLKLPKTVHINAPNRMIDEYKFLIEQVREHLRKDNVASAINEINLFNKLYNVDMGD
jgi:uncharacterized ubiquitin-like protein YukD